MRTKKSRVLASWPTSKVIPGRRRASDLFAAGVAAGHHALRGAHGRDAHAAADERDLLGAGVDPQPRLAHAAQVGDHLLPARAVILQGDADLALRRILDELIAV